MDAVSAALAGGVVAVGVAFAAPYALAVIGFTKAGILPLSIAAKLMSWAAISNGGGVAAGGVVAFFQSLGAAGVSTVTKFAIGGIGAAVGWLINIFG